MMVEIALLQRMSVFLGHPTYALSVVLFSLILWTGFGSMISERVRLARPGKLIAWSVASTSYLFALAFWLPRSSLTSMERTFSFAPASAFLSWRQQAS